MVCSAQKGRFQGFGMGACWLHAGMVAAAASSAVDPFGWFNTLLSVVDYEWHRAKKMMQNWRSTGRNPWQPWGELKKENDTLVIMIMWFFLKLFNWSISNYGGVLWQLYPPVILKATYHSYFQVCNFHEWPHKILWLSDKSICFYGAALGKNKMKSHLAGTVVTLLGDGDCFVTSQRVACP